MENDRGAFGGDLGHNLQPLPSRVDNSFLSCVLYRYNLLLQYKVKHTSVRKMLLCITYVLLFFHNSIFLEN